jgi:hypothetical protein
VLARAQAHHGERVAQIVPTHMTDTPFLPGHPSASREITDQQLN